MSINKINSNLLILFIFAALQISKGTVYSGSFEASASNATDTKRDIQELRSVIRQMQHQISALEKHQSRSYIARTCHELMNSDPTLEEGMYFVDPDGFNVGDAPVQVHCSRTGETTVLHDTMEKMNVGHCFDPGCYTRLVNYNASMRQMRALIDLSPTCKQFIRYDCFSAVLAFEGIQYGWWNDRNGIERYYWTGSNDTLHTCACGVTGECVDPSVMCDCDAVAPVALFDEGYITNRQQLPITRLSFGRTSPSYSSGDHTLGPLRCSGSNQMDANIRKPTSCADLWRAGNVVSGIYLVQPLENNTVLTVFCDMTKLPEDAGHQTLIGTADVKSNPIHFSVGRTSHMMTAGIVTYEIILTNMGNALDIRSGKFTAPVKGVYSFSFHCLARQVASAFYIRHNGVVVGNGWTATTDYETTGNQVILTVQKGDVVYVELRHGSLFDGVSLDRYTLFSGSLLQEF